MAELNRTRRGKKTTRKTISAGTIGPGASKCGNDVFVSLSLGTVFSPDHTDGYYLNLSESEWQTLVKQVSESIESVRKA